MDLGECQILGVREVQDKPQFIASSRHVSMDAVSVKAIRWNERILTADVSGIEGTKENYYFAIPSGVNISKVEYARKECQAELAENILKVTVRFDTGESNEKITIYT